MQPLLSAMRGDIGIITMNNDAQRNVLCEALVEQLVGLLAGFRENRGRVVILRANPGVHVWSAGHDVDELPPPGQDPLRSEEHTSELQSHHELVCRLLLEKKKKE